MWAVTVSPNFTGSGEELMCGQQGGVSSTGHPACALETAHKPPERRPMAQTSATSINPACLWFGDST